MMRIEYASVANGHAPGDAYIDARASSVTDLATWRLVVREAYGIASHTILARDGKRVKGVLTLFEIRHRVFGHYLTTAVFGNDGGLLADTDAIREALVEEARALAGRLQVAYLVVRTRDQALAGFQVDGRYRSALVDLGGDADAAFKRLPSKTRNQVRRGQREGFTIATGPDQIAAFFEVFHEHMRDLGSPAHGRRFYEALREHLSDCGEFYVVRDGGELAAGALVFRVNGTAMNYHTVALRRFNTRCVNYLLYWRMMADAMARGCTRFDMGRSEEGSTQLAFKANWAPREVSLYYNYFSPSGAAVPVLSPRNPKYRLAIAAWQRLPLAVTRWLGPRVISGIA